MLYPDMPTGEKALRSGQFRVFDVLQPNDSIEFLFIALAGCRYQRKTGKSERLMKEGGKPPAVSTIR